jgi:hypothetical protein
MAKVRLAAAACGVALVLLLAGTSLVALARRPVRNPVVASGLSANLTGGTIVRIMGVSAYPPDENSWFTADGHPIDLPDERLLQANAPTAVPPHYVLAMTIERPPSDVMRLHVAGSVAGSNIALKDADRITLVCLFAMGDPSASTANIQLGIADNEWRTIAQNEAPQRPLRVERTELGAIEFQPIEPEADGSQIVVRHPPSQVPTQMAVLDTAGQHHIPASIALTTLGAQAATRCTFHVPPDDVQKVLLQARTFSQFVDGSEISLERGRITTPTMSARAAESPKR